MSKPRAVSAVLKISIFATGLAGIVAEFVLSTLATYIIGNAVLQWTRGNVPDVFRHGAGQPGQLDLPS